MAVRDLAVFNWLLFISKSRNLSKFFSRLLKWERIEVLPFSKLFAVDNMALHKMVSKIVLQYISQCEGKWLSRAKSLTALGGQFARINLISAHNIFSLFLQNYWYYSLSYLENCNMVYWGLLHLIQLSAFFHLHKNYIFLQLFLNSNEFWKKN